MIIWKLMNSPLADDDGQSLFSALWSCWGLTGVDWSWTAEPWRDREGCKWNRENHSCPGCMMNTRTQVYTVCYLSILRLVLLLYLHNWPYYYVVLYICKWVCMCNYAQLNTRRSTYLHIENVCIYDKKCLQLYKFLHNASFYFPRIRPQTRCFDWRATVVNGN